MRFYIFLHKNFIDCYSLVLTVYGRETPALLNSKGRRFISREVENSAKEKETENSVSLSAGCAYTPAVVELRGLAPRSYEV